MPKAKYDRADLKLKYFQSEIDDVKAFFKQLWSNYLDWNTTKKTKWWSKEKQEYKQKIIEKALKDNLKKQAKELEIDIEVLKKWKKNALVWIINQLSKNSERMSMSDRVKWLNALKTELWEPTTVSKNENINKSEPLNESDFIRD